MINVTQMNGNKYIDYNESSINQGNEQFKNRLYPTTIDITLFTLKVELIQDPGRHVKSIDILL